MFNDDTGWLIRHYDAAECDTGRAMPAANELLREAVAIFDQIKASDGCNCSIRESVCEWCMRPGNTVYFTGNQMERIRLLICMFHY